MSRIQRITPFLWFDTQAEEVRVVGKEVVTCRAKR